MASKTRPFTKNGVYHVYNRGNHRGQIFYGSEDYNYFLTKLHDYAQQDEVDVLAYCLMSNHFHLLLQQMSERSIASLMMKLSVSYAKYHNWQYEQVGHVFQGRYGVRTIYDGADVVNVARYIHRNPVTDLETYRWSDYSAHIEGSTNLLKLVGWQPRDYEAFVSEKINTAELQTTSKVAFVSDYPNLG